MSEVNSQSDDNRIINVFDMNIHRLVLTTVYQMKKDYNKIYTLDIDKSDVFERSKLTKYQCIKHKQVNPHIGVLITSDFEKDAIIFPEEFAKMISKKMCINSMANHMRN